MKDSTIHAIAKRIVELDQDSDYCHEFDYDTEEDLNEYVEEKVKEYENQIKNNDTDVLDYLNKISCDYEWHLYEQRRDAEMLYFAIQYLWAGIIE